MSDPTKYTAAQLRAAMRAWANTLGTCEGYTFSNQIEAPFREIVEDVIEAEEPKQPSDPKHLPPRDCLVAYQDGVDKRTGTEPYWIQANFQESDGEHDDRWVFPYSREIVDIESVITWRELPEVE